MAIVIVSVLLNIPRFFQYEIIQVRRPNQTHTTMDITRSAFGSDVKFEVVYKYDNNYNK